MSHKHESITVRRGRERGLANLGWLKSQHTLSFAEYYDPLHMGFRSLRAMNEDRVAAGGGFPMHPHRDMEIFSYVLEGQLEHQDSLGNGCVLEPGQIQLMSTGSGVQHSEFNPSEVSPTHFLQIWIQPREKGLPPSYTEWHPSAATAHQAKVLVISPDGRDQSAVIHQDAEVYRLQIPAGDSVSHELEEGRGLWVQVMRGSLSLNGVELHEGDGAHSEKAGNLDVTAIGDTEALLFDLG